MKGNTLPRALRFKGKSKYLFCRLREEKLNSLNDLYEKYFPTKFWNKIKKFFRDIFTKYFDL